VCEDEIAYDEDRDEGGCLQKNGIFCVHCDWVARSWDFSVKGDVFFLHTADIIDTLSLCNHALNRLAGVGFRLAS
jgi:hypothetical protein